MKKIYLYSTFVLLFTLSSCSGMTTGNTFTFSADENNAELFDGYYKPHRDALRYYPRDINSQIGWYTSNTIGEQKILVVPVQLTDAPIWTSNMINEVNIAFFGDSNQTAFYSVHDFFYKSSYGKLNLTGEVSDILQSNYSVKALNRYGESAPEYIIKEFLKADISKYKNYNLDNDNFLDNVVFLYSNNYSTDSDSSYWAWCSYYSDYKSELTINNFMWASYQFLKNGYYDKYNQGKLETHTFIHETGHLLGLDDYYCYDDLSSWDPAGALDMQSYNVGDHNVYSKLSLGWINPYVVTGDSVIKLKTSSKYPEAILINNKWNGSIFDEYLLIEYYTPTNLNEQDSKHNFNGRGKMYSYNGLRIYHVDARLVETSINSITRTFNKSSEYTETLYNDYVNNKFSIIGASNSVTRSYLQDYSNTFRQLHLLDQGEKNYLPSNNRVGNINPSSALWTNRTFTPNNKFFQFSDRFNNKSKIGYEISVRNLTKEDCEVVIKKINN